MNSVANDNSSTRLSSAITLSLLLHLSLLLLPGVKTQKLEKQLELVLLPRESQRIVAPSDAPETEEPLVTNKLSDKNTITEKETIRKGLPGAAPQQERQPQTLPVAPSPPPAASQAKPQAKPLQKSQSKPQPKEKKENTGANLRLFDNALANKFAEIPRDKVATTEQSDPLSEQPEKKLSDSERLVKLQDYVPFRQRSLASLFRGNSGVPDYLPKVQDGEITLLNAKADQHAVFVRRVALQVFGSLRKASWSELPYSGLRQMRGFSTVKASMSPNGKLISVELLHASGYAEFDTVVTEAAQRGTWDQNPPPGAKAADGNIHFIFKSKTWARKGGEGVTEQRWLLLSTGLL